VEPVEVLRTRFPALEFHEVQVVGDGWDSRVLDLDDEWTGRRTRLERLGR
jgi:hypothetical protein